MSVKDEDIVKYYKKGFQEFDVKYNTYLIYQKAQKYEELAGDLYTYLNIENSSSKQDIACADYNLRILSNYNREVRSKLIELAEIELKGSIFKKTIDVEGINDKSVDIMSSIYNVDISDMGYILKENEAYIKAYENEIDEINQLTIEDIPNVEDYLNNLLYEIVESKEKREVCDDNAWLYKCQYTSKGVNINILDYGTFYNNEDASSKLSNVGKRLIDNSGNYYPFGLYISGSFDYPDEPSQSLYLLLGYKDSIDIDNNTPKILLYGYEGFDEVNLFEVSEVSFK